MELSRQLDVHWQRRIYEYGYTGRLSWRECLPLSPSPFVSLFATDLQDSQLLATHSREIGCFYSIPFHLDVSHSP